MLMQADTVLKERKYAREAAALLQNTVGVLAGFSLWPLHV